ALCPSLATLSPYTTLFRSFFHRDERSTYAARNAGDHRRLRPYGRGEDRTADAEHVLRGAGGSRQCIRGAQTELWGSNLMAVTNRSEEHTSELQSRENLVCR